MLTTDTKQSIFAITGMHRSGTSLTASLLESAGVYLGKRLMAPSKGNAKGYFENLDFVEFQEDVLYSQGISKAGWTLEKQIQVQEQYLDRAKLIVQKNSFTQIWGWKDPRTTLFLNFWANMLPEAKFILIYRAPWEVIDSLYRRGNAGDEVFKCNPNFALKVWINYNQTLLNFYNQFPGRCLLLSIYSVINDPIFLIKAIEEKFGIFLEAPASDIYDASLLHTQISGLHRSTLIRHYFPEACKIYQELNAKALQLSGFFASPYPEVPQVSSYEVWALQDWLDVRRLERQESYIQTQLQQAEAELGRSQSQLQDTQVDLERSQSQLQQTQAELGQSQSQLLHTETELERSQSQLKQTRTEFERLQSQLQDTQVELGRSQSQLQQTEAEKGRSQAQVQQTQEELENSQAQVQQTQEELENSQAQLQQIQTEWVRSQAIISGMESSKFWKLRTAWFRIKQVIGLTDNSPPTSSASLSSQTTDPLAKVAIPRINSVKEIKFKTTSKGYSNGFFDGINGSSKTEIEVLEATTLTATGWAILADECRIADKVILTYGKNNSLFAEAPVNLQRLDVANFLNNPAYSNSGWSATFNSANLPIGKVVLKAWAYNAVRKEATRLNFAGSNSGLSQFSSRLKHRYAILRVKGVRYALAKLSEKLYYKASPNEHPYAKWLNKNSPRKADLQKMTETLDIFSYKPVISVIMPVFNTPENYLRQAIESVLTQVYPYWELCIADDASTKPYIRSLLEEYISKDSRVKVVFRNKNGHISSASNSALEIATGEFVSLLDHDDLLTPDALYEVALLLNKHLDADMIYSDEDKIDEHNQLKDPFFKPDWCPDSFLSRMYTCHLGTYRRSLVDDIGGFRVGYEGSQDYDLVLRLTEKTERIFHIPKVLYHWRVHPGSTATGIANVKSYAYIAAEKALADALDRRGEKGRVTEVPAFQGNYTIRYEISEYKLVSIIIPTKNLGDILDKCLESIFQKSIYPNYEVIVIDNGSTEENTAEVISKWLDKEPNRFRCYPLNIPFNYSKINNYAVSKAHGEYLLFLNNDTEVITPDWINAMVEQAQRPSIGAVGALLLYPDNSIQHAGVVIGLGGVAAHSHRHFPATTPGYVCQVKTINNYSAVTGACLMCRRDVYESVGEFDEELAVAYNDIDLCLKMVDKGYKNIYLPHVVLYHYESKSRGYENTPEKLARLSKEAQYLQSKWQKVIDHDPCYNPHLTRAHEDYSINL